MNEQSIQKQYNQIVNLLEDKRLKEALVQLDAFLYNGNDWSLRNRLEQIQTSYQYMLQYMKLGMKDPERQKLYRQLLADTWEIADQTRIALLDEISTHYYHSLRRNPKQLPKAYGISTLQKILEGFADEMAVSQLANYQGLDAILRRHEETHQVMFLTTWSNSSWTLEEFAQAENMLRSETLPTNDLCLFVSAVTLSLMECFDERKVNWLLDGLRHTNPQINQRALVGLVITLHLYPSRIALYPELEARISLFREDPNFSKQVNRIYIQLLRSQETEKIDRKMREEIIPEMMKNVNIMRNMKFGFEETDENDRNPDWEQAFEQSGLGDKIREMNDLQLEGADVLDDVSLHIPQYKVTAIVGASGSGKTTLIKLMLGFYTPNKGAIKIQDTPLENINPHLWRARTGSVMQDGFIFSETIAQNIAVGEEQIDIERLRHAVTIANIRDFIDSLPLGYNTKIGMEGNGISQGQRQRILIARAVYKNPDYLFFDEATNALDANNEREIMEHLHEFYKGKTVVVVAHRLSTVRDADNIIVLDKGKIAEEGTHKELAERKGLYYRLVKNQLELGN